jgi:hypothetical protein
MMKTNITHRDLVLKIDMCKACGEHSGDGENLLIYSPTTFLRIPKEYECVMLDSVESRKLK